ncbi:hypothetical protein [Helicovermis profundi]|uniref:Uncharacterized protein n=1 Tax=Helicovermis profundi TaxID=3065157 RepID=A0AAU9E6M6_9FIRM|nr:hypothetical protein HLPR_27000 [Clostridia bacterium S502]
MKKKVMALILVISSVFLIFGVYKGTIIYNSTENSKIENPSSLKKVDDKLNSVEENLLKKANTNTDANTTNTISEDNKERKEAKENVSKDLTANSKVDAEVTKDITPKEESDNVADKSNTTDEKSKNIVNDSKSEVSKEVLKENTEALVKTDDLSLDSLKENDEETIKISKEAIITKYEAMFIELQKQSSILLNDLIAAAKTEYMSYSEKDRSKLTTKVKLAGKYLALAKELEKRIDKIFYNVLDKMKEELINNNYNADIIKKYEDDYKSQKAAKSKELMSKAFN